MSVLDLIKDPQETKEGLRVLSYGSHSTRKTLFGLTFNSILVIDSDKGLSFYKSGKEGENIKKIADTRSYYDLIDLLEWAAENAADNGIETIMIDSLTPFKNDMEDVILTIDEKRAREAGKDENEASLSQRSWGRIKTLNNKINNLILSIASTGVNVIGIAQAREIKEKDRAGDFVVKGYMPDAAKLLEHVFDVVLFHHTKTTRGETEFFATVQKDRSHVFKVGETVKDPHFSMWSDRVPSKGLVDETNFVKQSEGSMARYEAEIKKEEMSAQERMAEIIQSLDADGKKELQAKLAKAGITKFEGLTTNQQKKLDAILNEYA